jgi:glutamate formiminotransferase
VGNIERLVEIVPNVSEGRDREVIDAICAAARAAAGAKLLDVHFDAAHHRSVLTVVGSAESVCDAAFRITEAAGRLIDMAVHRGVHPRLGALDVLPFVPVGDTPMALCIDLAHQTGRRVADELGIPVYFYAEAALRPERRSLARVRNGEYEGLAAAIAADPARVPDLGPTYIGKAGAAVIGARPMLVAFNMHLRTYSLGAARAIARSVRASNGGLAGVQALGFPTNAKNLMQVSMNLFDLAATSAADAVRAVEEAAWQRDIELADSELVGLMPFSEVERAAGMPTGGMGTDAEAHAPDYLREILGRAAATLRLSNLEERQVLELAVEWK